MAKIIDIKLTRIVYNLTVDFLVINLSSQLLLGELNRTSKVLDLLISNIQGFKCSFPQGVGNVSDENKSQRKHNTIE